MPLASISKTSASTAAVHSRNTSYKVFLGEARLPPILKIYLGGGSSSELHSEGEGAPEEKDSSPAIGAD